MKKNIVVLGATGTVGSKIARILLEEEHNVTLLARNPEKLASMIDRGARIIKGDILDTAALTEAFRDADSAFVLLPDNMKALHTRTYQREVTGALIKAIEASGIRYIVNMSSVGSHMHEGNGMMGGTAEQEVRLNQLKDVNVLHLRSAYFMENFLRTIGLVKKMGINGSAADSQRPIPMVATKDVARIAADHLAALDFTGKSVQAVMGPRDYSLSEFNAIMGAAIGMPDLPYIQFPAEQARQTFVSNGLSEDFADNLLGMATAIKTGFMNYETRNEANTTATTAEDFAAEVYAPAFNTQS